MKALGLFLGILIAAAACGDDQNHVGNDGGQDSGPPIDGSNSGSATLTSFVIDLVLNHGSDATPATFDSFSNLPDPDGSDNNGSAYSSLF